MKKLNDNPDFRVEDDNTERGKQSEKPGRVLISIDVHELGSIEMEVLRSPKAFVFMSWLLGGQHRVSVHFHSLLVLHKE